MTTFLALYHGDTVNSSELLAVTADRRIVEDFAIRLLSDAPKLHRDPVVRNIEEGRRNALEVVSEESMKKGRARTHPDPTPSTKESS